MADSENLRQRLSQLAWHVTQEKGTERAFTSDLYYNKATGAYNCIVCSTPLFLSDTKYDSGTGWPSFYQPVAPTAVVEHSDHSHGMVRTEVACAKCRAHLGHVFEDGPRPSGLRYCINGVALQFDPNK